MDKEAVTQMFTQIDESLGKAKREKEEKDRLHQTKKKGENLRIIGYFSDTPIVLHLNVLEEIVIDGCEYNSYSWHSFTDDYMPYYRIRGQTMIETIPDIYQLAETIIQDYFTFCKPENQ